MLENGHSLLTCSSRDTYFQGLEKGLDIDIKYRETKRFQKGMLNGNHIYYAPTRF